MNEIMVVMTIVCSVANGAELKEIWRIQHPTSLQNCLQMNATLAVNGTKAAVTVKCQSMDDWAKDNAK